MGFWKIALVSLLLGNNSVLSQNNRLFYDYDNNGNRISRTNNIESKDHRIMITASVDIPYLEYDVAVDVNNHTLDTLLAVGSTPYFFDIAANGASNFSIPLSLPVGNGGIGPNLEIVYNSYSGDGVLGTGINLSCLSSITRSNEESRFNELYSWNKYYLDGIPLIAKWVDGKTVYYKENNDYSLITRDDYKRYFVLTTQDGMKYYYGDYKGTRAYQLSNADQTTIISWYLACQEDPYGNYILYNYQQDIENADIWLKSIEYTLNDSCNYTQTNRIDFLYNRVKDVPTGFLNGFRVKRDKILKEIFVFAGSEQVRIYKMKYIKDEKDIYPKLNNIQEFGKNNVAYNPIIIGWGKHQGEKCLQKYAFEHRPTDVIQGDFNGDGIEDFLTIDKQYIMRPPEYMDSINIVLEVQTIDKKGNREKIWTTTIYDQNYSFTVIPGDFNGDGLLDLAMLTKDDTHFIIMKAYLNEEGKLGYKTTTRLGGVASPVLVGHFEGNRKDQLLIGNKCYSFDDELVKYTSLEIKGTLPNNGSYAVIDVDGDKYDDIIVYDKKKKEVVAYAINSYGSIFELTHFSFNEGEINDLKFGYFNNDRYADIFFYCKSGEQYKQLIYYYNGKEFIKGEITESHPNLSFLVADFNNDGISELMSCYYTIDQDKEARATIVSYPGCHFTNNIYDIDVTDLFLSPDISPGTTRLDDVYSYKGKSYVYPIKHDLFAGDFTGDGRADVLAISQSRVTGPGVITRFRDVKYSLVTFDEQCSSDVVIDIIDGNAGRRSIEYNSHVQSRVSKNPLIKGLYTHWNKQYSLIRNVNYVLTSDLHKDIHIGKKSYSYTTPFYRKDKGNFVGFEKQIITDSLLNTITVNTYNVLGSPCILYLAKSEYRVGHEIVSSTNYGAELHNLSGSYYLRHTSVFETDLDKQCEKVEQYTYDEIDNIIISDVSYQGFARVNNMPEKRILTNYQYVRPDNLLYKKKPSKIITVYTRDGANSITQTKRYAYTPQGKISLESFNSYFKRYQYNVCGLLVAESIEDSITKKQFVYEYDTNFLHRSKTISPTGLISTNTADVYGNTLINTGPGNLKTYYTYDDLFRPYKIKAPDGTVSVRKAIRGGRDKQGFYVANYVILNGNTEKSIIFNNAIHYDCLGREIRKEKVLLNGTHEHIDIFYNEKGLSEKLYSYRGKVLVNSKEMYYDNKNRIIQEKISSPVDVGKNGKTIDYVYYDPNVRRGKKVKAVITNASTTDSIVTTMIYNRTALPVLKIENSDSIVYQYDSADNLIKVRTVGYPTEDKYTDYGLRVSHFNNSTGKSTYEYNNFNELVKEVDGQGNKIEYAYDKEGRIITKTTGKNTVHYIYDALTGWLKGIESLSHKLEYLYDNIGRVIEEKKTTLGIPMVKKYQYDNFGRLSVYTSPSGFKQKNVYDDRFCELVEIRDITTGDSKILWKRTKVDSLGYISQVINGDNRTVDYTYNNRGEYTHIYSPGVIDFLYQYDHRDLMLSRKEKFYTDDLWKGFDEHFSYDTYERLIASERKGKTGQEVSYSSGYRIASKSDIGSYLYTSDKSRIHSISTVSERDYYPSQILTFSTNNRIATIQEKDKIWTYDYDVNEMRAKAVLEENGIVRLTKYYFSNYEKECTDNQSTDIDYIYAGENLVALRKTTENQVAIYFVYSDNLGSIRCLTDFQGNVVQQLGYDAWGQRRNPLTGEKLTSIELIDSYRITRRGFTTHEHIDEMNLINMNARIYDPLIGCFISVDPHAAMNYIINPYTYCNGNPLKWIDLTGEDMWSTSDPDLIDRMFNLYKDGQNMFGKPYSVSNDWFYLTHDEFVRAYAVYGVAVFSYNGSYDLSSYGTISDGEITIHGKLPKKEETGIPSVGDAYSMINYAVGTYTGIKAYSRVHDGMWRGMDGKWYKTSWGGNQYTGARSTVMKKALRLEKIGKYMFCLDAVINGVVIWNNASENNYELIFQSSANIVFGYISTYGGPPGMIVGTMYYSMTFAPHGFIFCPITEPTFCSSDNTYVEPYKKIY